MRLRFLQREKFALSKKIRQKSKKTSFFLLNVRRQGFMPTRVILPHDLNLCTVQFIFEYMLIFFVYGDISEMG